MNPGRPPHPTAQRPAGPRGARDRRAFSLMEVMVAVALLAIALVGLTRGLVTALASSRDSAIHSQAVWVAASRIEFLRADYLPAEGETEGTSGPFTWKQTIARTATDGLFEVRVEVTRTGEPGALYTLATQIFDPPPSSGESSRERERDRRRERRNKGGSR